MFGDAPDLPDFPDPEWLTLPYTLAHAYSLWNAWDKHGVMPQAGGYDDQPRQWQRMIHLFNRRYSPLYRRASDEHLPPETLRGSESEDVLDDLLDRSPFVDGAVPSWEQFARGHQ